MTGLKMTRNNFRVTYKKGIKLHQAKNEAHNVTGRKNEITKIGKNEPTEWVGWTIDVKIWHVNNVVTKDQHDEVWLLIVLQSNQHDLHVGWVTGTQEKTVQNWLVRFLYIIASNFRLFFWDFSKSFTVVQEEIIVRPVKLLVKMCENYREEYEFSPKGW